MLHRLSALTALAWLACSAVTLGDAQPVALDLQAEYRQQHAQLVKLMKDRAWCGRVAGQVADTASLIADTDRDPADVVLRRSGALLRHLESRGVMTAELRGALDTLVAQAQALPVEQADARLALFLRACELRRRVTLANPLLDFDRVVFLAKHRPVRGDHHMVDQYYGFNAQPGGGVRILHDPFGEKPTVTDPLAGAKVTAGRLAGRTLDGGAFDTLELDYDGQTLAFAYTERGPVPDGADWSDQPWSRQRAEQNHKPFYFWHPTTTYSIFRAKIDGSGLTQLIDGPFNEFDPCFLPNGDIVFISERRGGFLRCGGNRPNPVFTLHRMTRDGQNVVRLSHHETHEWNPSVDHAGRVVYTRWDYVDRDTDAGHHLWTTFPDGRDPRAPHGNYPLVREHRPWMELSIRAVPGSRKHSALAAPHHGYNYGSIVLIDTGVADDGVMSQVKRIAPEAHFPESESAPGQPHAKGRHRPKSEFYGSPWPLDEHFFLCVYDAGQRNDGIYLVDVFGNRELIYRDAAIGCLDPIPLRPRPRPPVLPDMTTPSSEEPTGTVVVLNVYESDFEWPADAKVAALRVVQLLPKTTFHMHEPRVGLADQSLARSVVGVVPVEADGSAHFTAPVNAPLYFQALDAEGLAIQSMRSATYLHPGETLTCVGCHEHRDSTPPPPAGRATPIALRRPASTPEPPHEGAAPVSFPRLVQPVLDRHCVGCHVKEDALDLRGTPGAKHGWTRSYESLAPFAWGLVGGNGTISINGSRSQPGNLGARASRLYRLLEQGHYDVKLSREDTHRLTTWLDTNSNFFGVYHETDKQAAGERVEPVIR